ncbi:MAG: acyl-CoA carboxylase subunit epsilon [Marmoricola sp.]
MAEIEETPEASSRDQEAPLLRIVTPGTTPEEVAAIVAVFSSLGGAAPEAPKARSAWAAPARRMRGSLPTGRGGWRLSGLPR